MPSPIFCDGAGLLVVVVVVVVVLFSVFKPKAAYDGLCYTKTEKEIIQKGTIGAGGGCPPENTWVLSCGLCLLKGIGTKLIWGHYCCPLWRDLTNASVRL
jgi:hypothetical protein